MTTCKKVTKVSNFSKK